MSFCVWGSRLSERPNKFFFPVNCFWTFTFCVIETLLQNRSFRSHAPIMLVLFRDGCTSVIVEHLTRFVLSPLWLHLFCSLQANVSKNVSCLRWKHTNHIKESLFFTVLTSRLSGGWEIIYFGTTFSTIFSVFLCIIFKHQCVFSIFFFNAKPACFSCKITNRL